MVEVVVLSAAIVVVVVVNVQVQVTFKLVAPATSRAEIEDLSDDQRPPMAGSRSL